MGDSMQDAIKLLRSMAPIFDPGEDYLNIVSAEEQMSVVAAQRQKELNSANADLKEKMRLLDAARTSSTRPPTVPSEEAHAKTLNDLDALRLSLAKSINDAEGILASKEAELAKLKEECASLETSDPAAEHDLDATALKLSFFRGLGFSAVSDKNGRVKKMLVRSQSGEVHSVSFGDGKSEAEYTSLLWKLASS